MNTKDRKEAIKSMGKNFVEGYEVGHDNGRRRVIEKLVKDKCFNNNMLVEMIDYYINEDE